MNKVYLKGKEIILRPENLIGVGGEASVYNAGNNTDSTPSSEIKKVVEEMLKSEMHIIAGIGIDDGSTNFNKVFSEMGIKPEWILTPKNDASEIRKAFQFVSQSAIQASQAAGNMLSIGGFGV